MNKKQENRYSMYLALRTFLAGQTTITNTLPNFGPLNTQFNNFLSQIDTLRNSQEADRSGVAKTKFALRTNLESASLDLSNKLVAFATISNLSTLLAEVKTTISSLRVLADTSLADKATFFYNRAQANLGNLTSYGITAATQTAFNTLISNYKNAIPSTRLSQNDRKQATDSLTQAFRQADSTLETIDTLVEIVRSTQPAFYTSYQSIRKTIQNGSKRLALNGQATTDNGAPLANAQFSIQPIVVGTTADRATAADTTEAPTPILKKTGAKGQFRLTNLAGGSYQITIHKAGYQTLSLTYHHTEGEPGKLSVTLVKE